MASSLLNLNFYIRTSQLNLQRLQHFPVVSIDLYMTRIIIEGVAYQHTASFSIFDAPP